MQKVCGTLKGLQANNGSIRVLSIIEADYVSGAAKNLLEFARHNLEPAARIQHALAAYRRGDSAESALIQTIRQAGIPVFVLTERNRFDLSVIRQIRQAATEWKADIVETNNVKSHFLLRASGLWRERKWIAFHHGFTAEDLKMKLYNQTTRWSLRAAHRVVTVCGPFADHLASQGIDRSRIVVKHNSVGPFVPPPPQAVEEARARIGAPAGTRLLLTVGRLSPEKGHSDLLEALQRLGKRGVNVHLAAVGEGSERARLLDQCKRLGVERNVTFTGLHPDVRPFYVLADVVVLPSHSEGSPHVLLEAMSAGCVIVATRVGGIPEMVRDGESAALVDSHSPDQLATTLEKVLIDASLRQQLTAGAQRRAAEEFNPERHWAEWTALYQSVLPGPQS